jgi:hypothetical protein
MFRQIRRTQTFGIISGRCGWRGARAVLGVSRVLGNHIAGRFLA